jgi:hypothetical protein
MVVGAAGADFEAVNTQALGQRVLAFPTAFLAQTLKSGCNASANATAFAAITCISGPP